MVADVLPILYLRGYRRATSAQHEIVVFTSTGAEGLPMTVIVAMSCAKAVTCAPTGGTPELVTDGHDDVYFRPAAAADLAHEVTLVTAVERRRRLGAAARETVVARFRQEDACKSTVALFKKVAAS